MTTKELVIATIKQIQKNHQIATPDVYTKTFCQLARMSRLEIDACSPARAYIEKLPLQVKKDAKNRSIESLDELVIFLSGEITRALSSSRGESAKIISELISLLAKAMTPSFAEFDTKRLNKAINFIEEYPIKTLEKEWQDKITKLVVERIAFDRKQIFKEAKELDNAVVNIYNLLQKTSQNAKAGKENISNIRSNIESLKPNEFKEELFGEIKEKLSSVANELEVQANDFYSSLDQQNQEIAKLKEEVANLTSKMTKLADENASDYLTNTQSRRAIESEIDRLERGFVEYKTDYIVLFFDVDHFKKINDTYTHEGGDKILQAVGSLLNSHMPKGASVGRYGGEEFLATLPSLEVEKATMIAEKIRSEIESSQFRYKNHTIKMTISCGLAARSEESGTEAVVNRADQRLYIAKKSGRNRVVFEDLEIG